MSSGGKVTPHISLEHCHFDRVEFTNVTFENGLFITDSDFSAFFLDIHSKGNVFLQGVTIRTEQPATHPGLLLSGVIDGMLQVGNSLVALL